MLIFIAKQDDHIHFSYRHQLSLSTTAINRCTRMNDLEIHDRNKELFNNEMQFTSISLARGPKQCVQYHQKSANSGQKWMQGSAGKRSSCTKRRPLKNNQFSQINIKNKIHKLTFSWNMDSIFNFLSNVQLRPPTRRGFPAYQSRRVCLFVRIFLMTFASVNFFLLNVRKFILYETITLFCVGTINFCEEAKLSRKMLLRV